MCSAYASGPSSSVVMPRGCTRRRVAGENHALRPGSTALQRTKTDPSAHRRTAPSTTWHRGSRSFPVARMKITSWLLQLVGSAWGAAARVCARTAPRPSPTKRPRGTSDRMTLWRRWRRAAHTRWLPRNSPTTLCYVRVRAGVDRRPLLSAPGFSELGRQDWAVPWRCGSR